MAQATPPKDSAELRTRSGFVFTVRPARPGDEALLEPFFDAVSAEDRRFRFLSAVQHVDMAQLRALTHVDHHRTENFLAFGGQGMLVATGMLACDQAMELAEVAIAIRADHKGRGIGWTLLEHVAGEARKRGVKALRSIESRDNHSAIELEREMGFTARPYEGDSTLVLLEARFQPPVQ